MSVTDPRSLVFSSQSNALGWTTTVTDPHANATSMGYDRNGLLRRVVNRVSGVVTMSYDSLARPVTLVANGDTTSFQYDNAASGQPHWAVAKTAAIKDSVNLDAMGRPTITVTGLGGLTWTQTSTYDAQGARNKLKISDGLNPADSLQFSVNVHNFPEYLPDFAGKWTRTYRGATTGLLDTIRFPTTGTASTDLRVLPGSYNAFNQPTSVLVKAGSSTLQNWRYEYDASGRITRVDTTLDTEHGYWSRQYTYDARGRLYSYRDVNYYPSDSTPVYDIDDENLIIGWEYSWGEYESHAVTYAPDYSGNRTDGSASYTNDRLTSMTGADGVAYSFTYDAEGRRLSKTALGYSQTYGWNDRGQLAWVKTNGDSVAFVYDAAGRRVEKHFATTTYYLWDGDNLVMEFNSLGGKRKYAFHPGVDHPVAVTINGTTYYYTLDEEGNVRGLWNSSNSESESYTYDPYGFLLSGGGSLNSLRWKGREFDSEVGLYYMRARWYDPAVGRFISEDPSGLGAGINPYAFADGETVNRADPSGKQWITGMVVTAPAPKLSNWGSWMEALVSLIREDDAQVPDDGVGGLRPADDNDGRANIASIGGASRAVKAKVLACVSSFVVGMYVGTTAKGSDACNEAGNKMREFSESAGETLLRRTRNRVNPSKIIDDLAKISEDTYLVRIPLLMMDRRMMTVDYLSSTLMRGSGGVMSPRNKWM